MDSIRKFIGNFAANILRTKLSQFVNFNSQSVANDIASGELKLRDLNLKPRIFEHKFTGIDVTSCMNRLF